MKIDINGKEYNIKFGYKPTLKERVISKVVKLENIADKNGNVDMERVEDLLLYLPELLLVGLQVHHKEFQYDIDTGAGKDKQLAKTFEIVEKYMESDNADVLGLFNKLQEAMQQDSFLSQMFRKEQEKAKSQETAE